MHRVLIRIFIGIVAVVATVVIGQRAFAQTPDTIFYNGKVITVDTGDRVLEAFALKGDRFLAVGSNAAIKKLAGSKTRRVDLGGHAVIPGLMDNHIHEYNAGLDEFRGIDMIKVPSLAEMLNRLQQAVAKAVPGEVVVTSGGWNENTFPEKRPPTRRELDGVSLDHPIVVFRGRSAVYLNSASLRAAGISRDTPTVGGNPVVKDAAGEPTGAFFTPPSVFDATKKIVPLLPQATMKEMLMKVQNGLHAWGFTSVREIELIPEAMRAFQSLWSEGKLTMRVSMGLGVNSTEWDRMDEILAPWGVSSGFGDTRLRLDSVAEFGMDVAGNSLLREPYTDRPNEKGAMRITAEQTRKAMLKIQSYGWRPAIHITGDGSLDAVLDAYEAANAVSPIRDQRWVVEHIPMVHPDQMERLARLGVVVSAQMQPYTGAQGMIRDFGQERAEHLVPMRELLDHKLIVSAGSDWAGDGDDNPFLKIYFYVTRKTRDGKVLGAAEKITRPEALRVSTYNNAYMTFEEKVKGSIEPGKLADFVVLSADILTIPEEQIPALRPLATYVGGQAVYASKSGGFVSK